MQWCNTFSDQRTTIVNLIRLLQKYIAMYEEAEDMISSSNLGFQLINLVPELKQQLGFQFPETIASKEVLEPGIG